MIDNIVDIFEEHVKRNPNAIAIVLNNRHWSYIQLNTYANFIAQLLLDEGIKPSSVVGVTGIKSFEMIAAIIAILKLKCSYMPLDLAIPVSRIEFMLKNAGAQFLVSHDDSESTSQFEGIAEIRLNYDKFDEGLDYTNLSRKICSDDAAYIMHTSGSTGVPKGVVIPHRGVIRLLVNTNYISINSFDSVLFHSNTTFDAAIFEIWAALLNGARIIISQHLTGDIPSVFRMCKENNISILLLTTGLFHIFSGMDVEKLTNLRYLVVGGDVMHHGAAIRVINKCKTLTVINGYGPAENCVFTTCLVIKNVDDIDNPVSIGKPINGTTVFLLDENLCEVKQGEIGEIFTSGEGVALGYINAPELTDDKFIRLPQISGNALLYRTGDMAKLLGSGCYEFIGRQDHQVKIRGFRVELTEIEHTISCLDIVEDVCVCVIGSVDKKIAAYIKVTKELSGDSPINKNYIVSFLTDRLPSYYIPSYIEINNNFPMTPNGKIDRKKLQNVLACEAGMHV